VPVSINNPPQTTSGSTLLTNTVASGSVVTVPNNMQMVFSRQLTMSGQIVLAGANSQLVGIN
jgi:hypothetical protein